MLNQQFSEKAGRLLDRINSISLHEKNTKNNETIQMNITNIEPKKTIVSRNINNSIPTSPQTQTILELVKI